MQTRLSANQSARSILVMLYYTSLFDLGRILIRELDLNKRLFNPYSSSIHIQNPQTDLRAFLY